jgi:hypothetical protein
MQKVALIEFGGSHEECLLTQILALKTTSTPLYWVTTSEMAERNPHLMQYFDEVFLVSFNKASMHDFKQIVAVKRFLKQHAISHVVFNTAQGAHVRNLCLIVPRKIKLVGIIHTIRKFQGSFTQKMINLRIKKYLVLSDFLLQKISPPAGITVDSFYPISYPHTATEIDKETGEIWITIAGGVEKRRKDLDGFLAILSQDIPTKIRFIFLGKSDVSKLEVRDFIKQVELVNKQQQVLLFHEFVSTELFDAYLKKSDFLLPLIHPNTPSAEQYIENQISGMFNLAYSYHIPLLIHDAYQTIEDLQLAAFFYKLETIGDQFPQFVAEKEELYKQISAVEKWKEAYQFVKFVSYLN